MGSTDSLLYTGSDWNYDTIQRVYDECEIIGREELRLDWYPNQFEIVNFENMLDVYSSIGMPMMYSHWSFGKSFAQNHNLYKQGRMGLALEMVINSNPCINYLMDENTMTGQALVIAHAAIGHNSFFKNNYLFKQWTAADSIIDYLGFAKRFIAKCEEKYGYEEVEHVLDAAHALMNHGVDRHHKPKLLTAAQEKEKQKLREIEYERMHDELWSLVPDDRKRKRKKKTNTRHSNYLEHGNEENLLYFLEKKSPVLHNWEREILRIVRRIGQYFSPQSQTKVINEGWASTVHYYIMNRLYEKGMIDNGSMLEFLALHTAVVRQEPYNSRIFGGFNPYHLGFSIFKDIRRISENPTDEDKEWFPDIAGGDWVENWKYAYENFRDESFIQQFLSPAMIREMKLFEYLNEENKSHYNVLSIHNDRGYKSIRKTLAQQNSIGMRLPDIQVSDVDFDTRECVLTHFADNEVLLDEDEATNTLMHFRRLWGFPVSLHSRNRKTNDLLDELNIG